MGVINADINGTNVNIYEVKDALENLFVGHYLFEDTDEPLDVRLRVFNGSWEVLSGDSQSDTDHRGLWSSGSITAEMTDEQLELLALDLVEELENAF